MYKGTQNLSYSFNADIINKRNAKRIENVEDWQFELSAVFIIPIAGKLILNTLKPSKIGAYKNPQALFYGVGRRGSNWRCSLLSVEPKK